MTEKMTKVMHAADIKTFGVGQIGDGEEGHEAALGSIDGRRWEVVGDLRGIRKRRADAATASAE